MYTAKQASKRKDPMHLTDVQQMERGPNARSHPLRRPDQDTIQQRRAVSCASRGGAAPASHNLPMGMARANLSVDDFFTNAAGGSVPVCESEMPQHCPACLDPTEGSKCLKNGITQSRHIVPESRQPFWKNSTFWPICIDGWLSLDVIM